MSVPTWCLGIRGDEDVTVVSLAEFGIVDYEQIGYVGIWLSGPDAERDESNILRLGKPSVHH